MSGTSEGTVALDALREAFARAARVCPPVTTTLAFAGMPVQLRVAGPRLAEVVRRPFTHIVVEGEAPPSVPVIELWSAEETGIALPPEVPRIPRGLIADPKGASVLHVEGAMATALDRRRGDLVGYRSAPGDLAGHERSKPFPELLAVWLHDHGKLKVHGGAIAVDGAGALVVGGSGAGKSTASLACAAAGLTWLGDDQVALGPAGEEVVHSLYATARLDATLLDRHPRLACGTEPVLVAGEKALLFLADAPGVDVGRAAELRAIVVPSAEPGPALDPLSPGAALRAVAPSSVLGVVSGGAAGFQRLGEMVARVPAFAARHGGRPEVLPDLVAEAIRRSR